MTRPFQADDLYRLRVPTEPRLSPDGGRVAFTLQTVAPSKDGYRQALWLIDADGSAAARQLTIGAKRDHRPRFSPDGRTLAFLSDRRIHVEDEPGAGDAKDREDASQVHLLPLDGGEARRLTDLPRGVDAFGWSPDGRRLLCLSSSVGATRKEDARRRGKLPKPDPGSPPEADSHFIDRLGYQSNGVGFVYHTRRQVWIVEVATGSAKRLTEEPAGVGGAAVTGRPTDRLHHDPSPRLGPP